MVERRSQTHFNILIACTALALAQTAHFYIYFDQAFWLSVKWSVKGSAIWFLIFLGVTQLMRTKILRLSNSLPSITLWILLTLFCSALQVFTAVSIDALLDTASRPFVDDFLHLFNKRWLQNSLVFGSFIMCWTLFQKAPQSTPSSNNEVSRLKISDGTQTHWLTIDDISHLESMGNYVCVYENGSKHVVRNTLKILTDELHEHGFLRVSRSALVNKKRINSYHKPSSNTAELTLSNGYKVAVGRTYWKTVKVDLEL